MLPFGYTFDKNYLQYISTTFSQQIIASASPLVRLFLSAYWMYRG